MSMFDFGSDNSQGNQDEPPNGKLFLNPTTGEPMSFGAWLTRFGHA
jgi:hypothetical protein